MFNFNIIVCRGLDMVYIKPLYTQAKNPAKPLSSSQAMLVTKHLIVLPPGARHIDGIARVCSDGDAHHCVLGDLPLDGDTRQKIGGSIWLPQVDGLFHGKPHENLDDGWGYPHDLGNHQMVTSFAKWQWPFCKTSMFSRTQHQEELLSTQVEK